MFVTVCNFNFYSKIFGWVNMYFSDFFQPNIKEVYDMFTIVVIDAYSCF